VKRSVQRDWLAGMELDLGGMIAIAQSIGYRVVRVQRERREPAMFPLNIQLASAAHAHAVETAVWPLLRQRGQDVDLSFGALHQHLGDGRRTTQIAVDLKRRAEIEHIWKRVFCD
jgi:hypothetical protein